MKKVSLWIVLMILTAGECFAQYSWEKLSEIRSVELAAKDHGRSKPYTDKDYNYGSDALPSPRIDAVTWADPKGGLWVFGGIGLAENYEWGLLADMWNYDPGSGKWRFIAGSRNQLGGEKDDSQFPFPRKEAATWVDKKGNLWMFGGRAIGESMHFSDMWKFDVGLQRWQKIDKNSEKYNKGSIRGGGKKGVSDTNSPGGRSGAAAWVDKQGKFWLFGGQACTGRELGCIEYYSDLWTFDTNRSQWSWINGSENVNQASPGKKKKQQEDQMPGSRSSALGWYDQSDDQLWMYGGIGTDSSGANFAHFSDMWVYSIKKDTWTLKQETATMNSEPIIYSASGDSPNNSPGFRYSGFSWSDSKGNLFLTGGHSLLSRKQIEIDRNIWRFSLDSMQWSVLPQNEDVSMGGGGVFFDEKSTIYVFGGREFDRNTNTSRPSNAIWKLIRK